jgi:hypothetical protein
MLTDTVNQNLYSGQGVILLAKLSTSNGARGSFFRIGNSPKFELSFNVERRKHKESMSGQRLVDKVQSTTKGGRVKMTIEDIRRDNLALLMSGSKVSLGSGSYSGSTYDAFPSGLVVGSIVQLTHPNASSIVVKDSAGSPATLVPNTDYRVLDADHGLIEILSLGSYTQPFRAQYSYAATDVITGLTANDDDEYELYLAAVNTEGSPTDQAMGVQIYRIVFDPTQLMSLINDEQGTFELEGEVLRHSSKADDSNYGGFCRLLYIDANS